MALSFSPQSMERIRALLPKYPDRQAACLPVLWIAQEEFGWISDEAMQLVADTLELSLTHVYGVVTFYTMFKRRPVGKYHVQICTNIACMLRDGYQVLERFEKALGIRRGETTPDGTFTLNEVECLAACGNGPCVQINEDYHEPVRPEDVEALVAKLRMGIAMLPRSTHATASAPASSAAPSGTPERSSGKDG